MITNDVQYRNTSTLLAQFHEAAKNLEAGLANAVDKIQRYEANEYATTSLI